MTTTINMGEYMVHSLVVNQEMLDKRLSDYNISTMVEHIVANPCGVDQDGEEIQVHAALVREDVLMLLTYSEEYDKVGILAGSFFDLDTNTLLVDTSMIQWIPDRCNHAGFGQLWISQLVGGYNLVAVPGCRALGGFCFERN